MCKRVTSFTVTILNYHFSYDLLVPWYLELLSSFTFIDSLMILLKFIHEVIYCHDVIIPSQYCLSLLAIVQKDRDKDKDNFILNRIAQS